MRDTIVTEQIDSGEDGTWDVEGHKVETQKNSLGGRLKNTRRTGGHRCAICSRPRGSVSSVGCIRGFGSITNGGEHLKKIAKMGRGDDGNSRGGRGGRPGALFRRAARRACRPEGVRPMPGGTPLRLELEHSIACGTQSARTIIILESRGGVQGGRQAKGDAVA